MNIQIVLDTVENTIKRYKDAFPELVVCANIDQYRDETIEAILAYEKKATLISKALLQIELEKYFNTGKEIFDEGFHYGDKRGNADNLLIGMLEMAWIEAFLEQMNSPQSEQRKTNTNNFKTILEEYGFFELEKVKILSNPSKDRLIELFSANGLPYCIAMFNFLGFLKYLEIEYFNTKDKLNKGLSLWFNSDKEGRAVKGNINTLSDYSRENKQKYTAHLHKETVQKDYEKLK